MRPQCGVYHCGKSNKSVYLLTRAFSSFTLFSRNNAFNFTCNSSATYFVFLFWTVSLLNPHLWLFQVNFGLLIKFEFWGQVLDYSSNIQRPISTFVPLLDHFWTLRCRNFFSFFESFQAKFRPSLAFIYCLFSLIDSDTQCIELYFFVTDWMVFCVFLRYLFAFVFFAAFGLGTMIYNGLELGTFFEIPWTSPCYQVLRGINPILQMVFTFSQMYFVFMNARVRLLIF